MRDDLGRRRIAVAGAIAAVAGALGYVATRGYFHVIIGTAGPSIILREARVNFHLALTIAGFVALVAGTLAAELAKTEARITSIERGLLRVALPLFGIAIALVFAWP